MILYLREDLPLVMTGGRLRLDHRAHIQVMILVPSIEAEMTCDAGYRLEKPALQVLCPTLLDQVMQYWD